jgi:NodT family efflux transporter outer membrane factor (OMF) lipoprotein
MTERRPASTAAPHPLRPAIHRSGAARAQGRPILAFLWVALIGGCAVGPDFGRPAAPQAERYTPAPLPVKTSSTDAPGGEAQRFVQNMDIPGQWWAIFHSEALNTLIGQALKANSDVQAAQAALRTAQENLYAQQGGLFPTVSASFIPQRYKNASEVSPTLITFVPYFNLFTAQVTVSYLLDIWGATRRGIESSAALAEQQRFMTEATYLTLTSNLVAAAIQEASLRAQIAATQKLIKIDTDALAILQRQFTLGQVARVDVAAQEATLAQAQATLPPLQKQLAQQRDLLTALAGRLPDNQPAETFELASLQLPADLPVSLPSKLVEHRPDIRSAEAGLHSASALLGVAIANMLPQVTLTATDGTVSTKIGNLFKPTNGFWTLGANLSETIFDGGTLLGKERAARAALDQAAAQYRSAVITAFQNVADSLHALQADADAMKAQVAAERSAQESLEIAQRQLQLGAVNYLAVITAEQTYQQALISRVQAQASRFADTAALFQALGGGWWNRKDVAAAARSGIGS